MTRKSRKLHKKQVKKPPGYEHEPPTGARGVASSLRGGFGSRPSFGSFGSNSALHESSRLGAVSGTAAGASLAFRHSAGHVSGRGR